MEKALFRGQTGSRANQVCHSRLLLTPMFFPFMSQAARPTLCPAGCKGPTVGREKSKSYGDLFSEGLCRAIDICVPYESPRGSRSAEHLPNFGDAGAFCEGETGPGQQITDHTGRNRELREGVLESKQDAERSEATSSIASTSQGR